MTEQIFQRSNAVLKLPADSLLLRWGDLYKLAGFLNDTLPRSICSFQFIIEDEKIQNFRNICKIEISYKKHKYTNIPHTTTLECIGLFLFQDTRVSHEAFYNTTFEGASVDSCLQ